MQKTNPQVVVSITPFYALVAAVMEGVWTPQLLVQSGASPHEYALKPSEIQCLQQADLIFWAGPALETFLVKPLDNLTKTHPSTMIVELVKTPGLLLLPVRHGVTWEVHTHSHRGNAPPFNRDMHFWLDPKNAILLTNYIVHSLSKLDPTHKAQYQKNGKNLNQRLEKLNAQLALQLQAVQNIPYFVFHDAYQYFEYRYQLQGVGAITLHPEIPPSAQRLSIIRDMIKKSKIQCIFTEPQFSSKAVHSIIQDLSVKSAELDPEGQAAQKNANGYFQLLENLANAMQQCLSHNPRPTP